MLYTNFLNVEEKILLYKKMIERKYSEMFIWDLYNKIKVIVIFRYCFVISKSSIQQMLFQSVWAELQYSRNNYIVHFTCQLG